MSATVCPINPPGHDWQNGLTCRWCHATRTVTQAILSQLSSRRGGNPADAQRLLNAYRAQVLAEATAAGEAYPGELAMLHGLIATLTAVAEHGDLNDVRKLLEEHKADDTAARAETKTATTSGFFQPGHLYAHGKYRFQCIHIATHPTSDRPSAWGWFYNGAAWRHSSFSPRQYQVRAWTDVNHPGEDGQS